MPADVLLIRPAPRRFSRAFTNPVHSAGRSYPIGLAYLAAALRRAGLQADLLDAWARLEARPEPLPRELSYLAALGDLRYCDQPASYTALGMSDDEILRRAAAHPARVIGLSSMFSGDHPDALRLAARIKTLRPDATVVFGGPATTASPEATLSCPGVDVIVTGEAEETFPLLVRSLLAADGSWRALPGVGRREGGKTLLNPQGRFIAELDSLASPAYELADPSFYRAEVAGRLEPYASLVTSRGCPHLCDFCTIYLSMGRKFRVHSPERVLAEVRHCVDRYGIRVFQLEDDNFGFDPERAKAVLRLLIKEFGPRRLVLRDHNGMTALSLRDGELVSLMAEAGFDKVMIALESSDPQVRRTMKKPGSVDHFAKAAAACEAAGITVGAYTIVGLPYSTVASDVETQLYCLSETAGAALPVGFYPIPTTPQHDLCVEKGWVRPETRYLSRLRSDAFVVSRPGYSRRDALTLVNLSLLFNMVKLAARSHAEPGRAVPFEEVLRRHREKHPVRSSFDARTGEGSLAAADGGSLAECDRVLYQAELLLRRGVLAGMVSVEPGRARFRAAKASVRVVRAFLRGLRSRPLRYPTGELVELSLQRAGAAAASR